MAATTAALVVGGLSATSSIAGSRAQNKQLESQAEAYERQAAETKSQGAAQERKIRREGSKYTSAMEAGAAASGVTLTGSVTDAITESMYNIELDAVTAQNNAMQSAYAAEQNAAYARDAKQGTLSTLLGAAASGVSSGLMAYGAAGGTFGAAGGSSTFSSMQAGSSSGFSPMGGASSYGL